MWAKSSFRVLVFLRTRRFCDVFWEAIHVTKNVTSTCTWTLKEIFIHICLAWPNCIKSSSIMTLYAIGVYWPFQESINTHSVSIKCHSTSTSYISQMVLWPPCSTPYLTVLWCSESRDKQTNKSIGGRGRKFQHSNNRYIPSLCIWLWKTIRSKKGENFDTDLKSVWTVVSLRLKIMH